MRIFYGLKKKRMQIFRHLLKKLVFWMFTVQLNSAFFALAQIRNSYVMPLRKNPRIHLNKPTRINLKPSLLPNLPTQRLLKHLTYMDSSTRKPPLTHSRTILPPQKKQSTTQHNNSFHRRNRHQIYYLIIKSWRNKTRRIFRTQLSSQPHKLIRQRHASHSYSKWMTP